MIKASTITKFKIGLLLFAFVISSVSIPLLKSTAVSASYNGNNLIDNAIFLKSNSMSQADIQSFLANKSSYLTNYVTLSGRDGANVSAAQIIYEAAQDYGINPQAILATIQKEQSLVTAQNPLPSQLNYAMGYGCPDSGTCSYPGFFNQIANGTWQLRFNYERANGNNTWWNSTSNYACSGATAYYSTGLYPGRTINFKDSTGAVYTTITLANAATSSLYCYTPHAYSTTSSPPYSGSYNFVNSFENWFGSSTNSHLSFSVIQDPSSAALYLETHTPSGGFKYYLPSLDIMKEWKVNNLPINQVSQSYFDSLITGNWVGHLVKDDWNNLFIVENGTLHYIQNTNYANIWGLDPATAVQSLGITYTIPSSTWAGRFVRDAALPSGQIWLVDGGSKRAIPDGNILYEWGYTPDQLTTVSSTYLNTLPTIAPANQYASDGKNTYLVDMNRKLEFANTNVENDFTSGQTASTYNASVLAYFQTVQTWQFVVDTSNSHWYMLENGEKHYITSSSMANLWGMAGNKTLTSVSPGFLATLPDGGNLTYIVQTQSPSMYWVIDNGTKRYIPNGSLTTAWDGIATPPIYSNQSLADLTRGADITSAINGNGSPFTYIMDNGTKRYLSSQSAVNGWSTGVTVSDVSNQLVSVVPEGSFINHLIKDGSGNGYLVMNGAAYPIDPAFYDAWGINSSTPSVINATITRYTSGSTLGGFIKINGIPYMVANGQKVPIKKYVDAYPSSAINGISLPNDYFNTAAEASYIIKSTNPTDNRTWLMTNGKKLLLGTFSQEVSYGYLSNSVQPTALPPATLNSIADSTQTISHLIQTGSSGIKFVNFGYSLGFPDGDTLTNYTGTSTVIQVSPSVFNNFALVRSTSRLIVDDYGNYYFMENGLKRHIMSGSVLSRYQSYNTTYLEGTTMADIPDGAPLN